MLAYAQASRLGVNVGAHGAPNPLVHCFEVHTQVIMA